MAANATPTAFLEPLSTGDIIDRSVRIYRQNVRALLGAAAGPFILGAVSSLTMGLGWNMALGATSSGTVSDVGGATLVIIGLACYFGYLVTMLLVYAGISRSIGDLIMLGQAVTIRGIFDAARRRLADLVVSGLLLGVVAIALAAVFFGVFFLVAILIGFGVAAVAVLQLPPWVTGVVFALLIIVVFGAIGFVLLPIVLSRIVFVPQSVVIEGQNAMGAFTRSYALGAGMWKGVLGVLLFTNCVAFSLLMALLVPIVVVMYLFGYVSMESAEMIQTVYGAVGQFASFLLIPVWAVSYTLMYFDSRVRKEGYDVEVLTRALPAPTMPEYAAAPQYASAPVFEPQPSADGRCPRCGHYILAGISCSACGWRGL